MKWFASIQVPITADRMHNLMEIVSGALLGNDESQPVRTLDLSLAIDLVRNELTSSLWEILNLNQKLLQYLDVC
jgi:hypothetical protein